MIPYVKVQKSVKPEIDRHFFVHAYYGMLVSENPPPLFLASPPCVSAICEGLKWPLQTQYSKAIQLAGRKQRKNN